MNQAVWGKDLHSPVQERDFGFDNGYDRIIGRNTVSGFL